ncbi:MAG TPA: ABC transporter ATP-binding protein [Polyangiales bacterium]|nr:ABC transporter ATP-binding protein [Polyangiales bacterium]
MSPDATAPLPSSAPIVELAGVRKDYAEGGGVLHVLRGIDLTIYQGEIVALLGPSGCGKSTLLNVIGCLDRPSAGEYMLGGRDVSRLSREEQAWVRLHYIGFVFQSFHLISHASALENVALPLYYAGVPRKQREHKAAALLQRVGLGDRLHHRPDQLSGGQRQRVAIARACVASPRLMLADEPTGALDSKSGSEVLELMSSLRAETGLTIVLVTHDLDVAQIAQRQVELRDGKVVAIRTAADSGEEPSRAQ